MKREIRVVDEKRKIIQCTFSDERWYFRETVEPKTLTVTPEYVPSVTWITNYFPKGIGYMRWLAEKGWDEAEAIKVAAGDKGSKVHYAIRDLIEGKTLSIDAKYKNNSTGEEEELSVEEWECLMSFVQWVKDMSPRFLSWEFVVWGDGYAGTVDLVCELQWEYKGDKWKPTETWQKYLLDFKTSQSIWPSHELQVSAYKHALDEQDVKLAILQVGYKANKRRYKLTEVQDKFSLFLATKEIWANENSGVKPQQKDLPMELRLDQGEKLHETAA